MQCLSLADLIVYPLVQDTREDMLQWLTVAIEANAERSKSMVHFAPCLSVICLRACLYYMRRFLALIPLRLPACRLTCCSHGAG